MGDPILDQKGGLEPPNTKDARTNRSGRPLLGDWGYRGRLVRLSLMPLSPTSASGASVGGR
jgi:hypothetical protein